jgi:hypothetical protein
MMVTIGWNPLGFHLVEGLPRSRGFNAEYYRDNILTELIRFRPRLVRDTSLFMQTMHACTFPINVAYFPDLPPSDFLFFGYVKHCL